MTDPFVHLHVHSEYSLLDGAAKPDALIDAALADDAPALAVTDHGVLYGMVDFYKKCQDKGLKFIPGMEAYFADDRLEKVSKKNDDGVLDKRYYHLTVLARNNEGYRNLLKLSSEAFFSGYYYKPRSDWDLLGKYSDGLIVTSGCLGGPVLQSLLHGDFDEACSVAGRLQDIVGSENFFIELQNHSLPEQIRTNPQLIEISRKLNAPLIATNDCHYVHHEDHVAHDSLLCLQTGSKIADEKRFRFENDQFYLKSAAEMRYLFREVPEACDNTLLIAESVDVEMKFGEMHLPVFPTPWGFKDQTHYLKHLVETALKDKYPEPFSETVLDRVSYELGVIDSLGLSSYFLILWDIVKFANEQGIRTGVARGSAGGSIVSYLLNITKIDPLKHNLIFERFLNPHRVGMADIDLDIDSRYRDTLINYVAEKYGRSRVAQIITFGRFKSRAAVRDAARVLGYEPKVGDTLAKAMPPLLMGKDTPLEACFERQELHEFGYDHAGTLRHLYSTDEVAHEVIDVARGLEGLVKQDGIHAAAVVIGDQELVNYLPLQQKNEDGKPGPVVTQFEMTAVEDLGLLKMDFLGLRNLDVITDCLKLVEDDIDIDHLPLDDFETLDLLRRGDTTGVFQLESSPMKALLRRIRPTSFDDIAAVVALYRPGPMGQNMHNDYADRKNGKQLANIFHEDAADILSETHNLMIYQEQVMRVSQRFAGYSMPEADNLRKLMGKKLVEKMHAERTKFVEGCVNNGYQEQFANELFDTIEAFGSYAFNSSHAYGYGYISYQTAYLKAHYPIPYMAALAGSVINDLEKCAMFLAEARKMGITVKPPRINESVAGFTATDTDIVVGLGVVSGVGESSVEAILTEREANGPFDGPIDFVQRVNPNSKVFKNLVLAGAFDGFGESRLGLYAVADDLLSKVRKVAKNSKGMDALFDTDDMWDFDIPKTEFSERQLLDHEHEMLGIYVSGHPLAEHMDKKTDLYLVDLKSKDENNREYHKVLTFISGVQVKVTKKGDYMANVQFEDETAVIKAVCFTKNYAALKNKLTFGQIGIATFKVGSDYNGEKSYILQGFDLLDIPEEKEADIAFRLFLPHKFGTDEDYVAKLKGILLVHKGSSPVQLYMTRNAQVKLSSEFKVKVTPELIDEIRSVFLDYANR